MTNMSSAKAGSTVPMRARNSAALDRDESSDELVKGPGVTMNLVTVWNLGGTSPTMASKGWKLPATEVFVHMP